MSTALVLLHEKWTLQAMPQYPSSLTTMDYIVARGSRVAHTPWLVLTQKL
jgi:hypothetical protein